MGWDTGDVCSVLCCGPQGRGLWVDRNLYVVGKRRHHPGGDGGDPSRARSGVFGTNRRSSRTKAAEVRVCRRFFNFDRGFPGYPEVGRCDHHSKNRTCFTGVEARHCGSKARRLPRTRSLLRSAHRRFQAITLLGNAASSFRLDRPTSPSAGHTSENDEQAGRRSLRLHSAGRPPRAPPHRQVRTSQRRLDVLNSIHLDIRARILSAQHIDEKAPSEPTRNLDDICSNSLAGTPRRSFRTSSTAPDAP